MNMKEIKEDVKNALDRCLFEDDIVMVLPEIGEVSFKATTCLNKVITVTMDYEVGYMALRTKHFNRKEMIRIFSEFLCLLINAE